MMNIKLLEKRGSYQLLSVNGVQLKLNWNHNENELRSFINHYQLALYNKDIHLLREICSDKAAIGNVFLLSIQVFSTPFINFFHSCCETFLQEGTLLTIKRVTQYFTKSNYIPKSAFGFLQKTMKDFQPILLSQINKALIDVDFIYVKQIIRAIEPRNFLAIVSESCSDNFDNYINNCCKQLVDNDLEISVNRVLKTGFVYNQQFSTKSTNEGFLKRIMPILVSWKNKQDEEKQILIMNIGSNLWNLPYKDIQLIRIIRLDFTDIPLNLRIEIQEYLVHWHKIGENPISLARRFHHLKPIVTSIHSTNLVLETFRDLTYVEVFTVFENLQQQRTDNGKKRYSLKSIQGHISEARLFFDWLVSIQNDPTKNPFRRLKFNNISSFIKSAVYIPDEVVNQITIAINDCPKYVQRIWLIMMNTGFRLSDVLRLESNCLSYNEKEQVYYLKVIMNKTLRARRKKGFDDYHSVPILSEELVQEIKEQIRETEKFRERSKTNYIFLKYANEKRRGYHITRPTGTTISISINNCIKRHQIKDSEGNIWEYGNHQCRKTLAVNLLTQGSSIAEVAEILDHMEEKTTRQYYQDVDSLKIAQLDHELFEMLFQSIDDDIRQVYTTTEFEELKKEILTGSRETPEGHGSCLKHVSFGPCRKKSCVGCSLLMTGPQKLPMWRKLRDEQISYIDEMKLKMLDQGITDYETYRDFQAECHLLGQYEDTITKIEKFIQERSL